MLCFAVVHVVKLVCGSQLRFSGCSRVVLLDMDTVSYGTLYSLHETISNHTSYNVDSLIGSLRCVEIACRISRFHSVYTIFCNAAKTWFLLYHLPLSLSPNCASRHIVTHHALLILILIAI